MVPEFLTLEEIREMNLDNRQFHGDEGVRDGNGRMCVGTGIDYDSVCNAFGLLNPVDELALRIALSEVDLETQFTGARQRNGLHIVKSIGAVNLRFSRSQQIKIWSIKYEYLGAHGFIKMLKDNTEPNGYSTGTRRCNGVQTCLSDIRRANVAVRPTQINLNGTTLAVFRSRFVNWWFCGNESVPC
jgi:hypothetical protein